MTSAAMITDRHQFDYQVQLPTAAPAATTAIVFLRLQVTPRSTRQLSTTVHTRTQLRSHVTAEYSRGCLSRLKLHSMRFVEPRFAVQDNLWTTSCWTSSRRNEHRRRRIKRLNKISRWYQFFRKTILSPTTRIEPTNLRRKYINEKKRAIHKPMTLGETLDGPSATLVGRRQRWATASINSTRINRQSNVKSKLAYFRHRPTTSRLPQCRPIRGRLRTPRQSEPISVLILVVDVIFSCPTTSPRQLIQRKFRRMRCGVAAMTHRAPSTTEEARRRRQLGITFGLRRLATIVASQSRDTIKLSPSKSKMTRFRSVLTTPVTSWHRRSRSVLHGCKVHLHSKTLTLTTIANLEVFW